MAEKAKAYKARYTKESGDSSDRVLVGTLGDNVMALDATGLSDGERDELTKLYSDWLAAQPTFKSFLESQGRSDVAATLQWKSFKRSGLSDLTTL